MRVQASPAPDTVSVCVLAPLVGPSDAANASSTSPPPAVLNGAVVRGPVPSEKTVLSTTGPPRAAPSETTSATGLLGAALAPDAGFWLITSPAGTVALFAV